MVSEPRQVFETRQLLLFATGLLFGNIQYSFYKVLYSSAWRYIGKKYRYRGITMRDMHTDEDGLKFDIGALVSNHCRPTIMHAVHRAIRLARP